MKKLLSILGVIGLTATSTTNLVACNTPKSDNNNENGGSNKPEAEKPQQPPENSNGKLVDINGQKDRYKFENEFKKLNDKGYFFIESDTYGFNKYLGKNNGNIREVNGPIGIIELNNDNYAYFNASKIKSIYYGNDLNEPNLPEIDNNTGKILKGNEKTD